VFVFAGCARKNNTPSGQSAQGLTVRVFDTDSYVFATTGIAGIASAKYNVVADKTLFVNPTHFVQRRSEGCESEGWINRERAGSRAEVGVEAFNGSDKKLSETPDDIRFTIN
jgi:hypothetical protein